MAAAITGDKELDRALRRLSDKSQIKIVKPALTSAVGVVAKQVRRNIPPRIKAARRGIGARVRTKNRQISVAKVGYRVGRANKAKDKETSRAKGRGVGFGAQNLHWWILGTEQRVTKDGRPTGAFPVQDDGIVTRAWYTSQRAAMQKFTDRTRQLLAREAAKK